MIRQGRLRLTNVQPRVLPRFLRIWRPTLKMRSTCHFWSILLTPVCVWNTATAGADLIDFTKLGGDDRVCIPRFYLDGNPNEWAPVVSIFRKSEIIPNIMTGNLETLVPHFSGYLDKYGNGRYVVTVAHSLFGSKEDGCTDTRRPLPNIMTASTAGRRERAAASACSPWAARRSRRRNIACSGWGRSGWW